MRAVARSAPRTRRAAAWCSANAAPLRSGAARRSEIRLPADGWRVYCHGRTAGGACRTTRRRIASGRLAGRLPSHSRTSSSESQSQAAVRRLQAVCGPRPSTWWPGEGTVTRCLPSPASSLAVPCWSRPSGRSRRLALGERGLLEEAGVRVIAPDLPSHSTPKAALAEDADDVPQLQHRGSELDR